MNREQENIVWSDYYDRDFDFMLYINNMEYMDDLYEMSYEQQVKAENKFRKWKRELGDKYYKLQNPFMERLHKRLQDATAALPPYDPSDERDNDELRSQMMSAAENQF